MGRVSNSKIRVILVDDEIDATNALELLLGSYADVIEISGIAHNTFEAEKLIKLLKPHAVFLDIEMPRENAFEFLNRIGKFNFQIVFVTAYDQFAIKALKLNALDYLLKPVSIDELELTVHKLSHRLNIDYGPENDQFKQIVDDYGKRNSPKYILLKGHNRVENIEIDSIFYIEASSSYSVFYYEKNKTHHSIMISRPIADYDELLSDAGFYRIHKSYLVNTSKVGNINPEDHSLISASGTTLPIGRRRFQDFLTFLRSQLSG